MGRGGRGKRGKGNVTDGMKNLLLGGDEDANAIKEKERLEREAAEKAAAAAKRAKS